MNQMRLGRSRDRGLPGLFSRRASGRGRAAVAQEYSDALNREVTYTDIRPEDWERELKRLGLPEHLTRHRVTMAELNRAGRYDRVTDGVERVTGRPANVTINGKVQ